MLATCSTLALALASLTTPAPTPASNAAARVAASELAGTWDGMHEPPGTTGGQPFSLLVEDTGAAGVRARLLTADGSYELTGELSEDGRGCDLVGDSMFGGEMRLELSLAGERLVGWGYLGDAQLPLDAVRASHELLERSLEPVPFAIDRERPATFVQVGLSDEGSFRLDDLLLQGAQRQGVVGLGVALVKDGEVCDVRLLGWEDYENDVPADEETQFRWGSISKPLTAVAAIHLASEGLLDLDADVRELVPEFPEKRWTLRARDILCHQSGITHYRNAVRTWETYDVPHPFEDRVLALDVFKESPLLFEPGTSFSYSTHAYSLLGAAMQRAGKAPFETLVSTRVLQPAGMTRTSPDFPSLALARRVQGYQVLDDGRVYNVGDDDVSWKLPGGGWSSTIGDLGRFAAALVGDSILSDEQKELLWTPQPVGDGPAQVMGLGFNVDEYEGRRRVSHGGAQRKARAFLAVLPEERMGLALMTNSEGTDLQRLAPALFELLLNEPD